MTGCVRHQGTGHRQIQAANTPLTISVHTPGHRDGQDAVTLITHMPWESVVFAAEQQYITTLELKLAEAVTSVATAADQAVWMRQLTQQMVQIGVG